MANMKLISLVDAAIKAEGAERQNDREIILQVMEDELLELHKIIDELKDRLDNLEAR
jgi:DNA mismatch repair ATPase MutS